MKRQATTVTLLFLSNARFLRLSVVWMLLVVLPKLGMAATVSGLVLGWGRNTNGETSVPAGLSNVIAIDAGDEHALALKGDGTVVAWGADRDGMSTVPTGLTDVIAVAAGGGHSVALKSDGTVSAWGSNNQGAINVPAGLSNVVAISAGDLHTLALKSDGTVVAWGYNYQGQCTIPANLSGVVAIAAGAYFSIALKSDGTVVAWGDGSEGQTSVPSGATSVTAIAAGYGHGLALKSNGTVIAWGRNDEGQCIVPAGLSGVTTIAAGRFHCLAKSSTGIITAWGQNDDGETTVPPNLSDVIELSAGEGFSLALVSDKQEHAIYRTIGHQTLFGNSKTTRVTSRGYFVFDPATNQATAIGGFVLNRLKLFTVVPLQKFRVDQVAGENGVSYTIIAKAESPGTQFANTILESVFLRGRNSLVSLSSRGSLSLPRVFSSTSRVMQRDPSTGSVIASETSGTFTLDILASRASNLSESHSDVVARLKSSFAARGFAELKLPPAE